MDIEPSQKNMNLICPPTETKKNLIHLKDEDSLQKTKMSIENLEIKATSVKKAEKLFPVI